MKTSKRIGVKFKDGDAFGDLCVALTEDSVPFSYAGFLTVVIGQKEIEQLTTNTESGKLFKKFKANGVIEIFPITSTGKRALPTREEAEKLLWELAESYEKLL